MRADRGFMGAIGRRFALTADRIFRNLRARTVDEMFI